MEKLKNHKGQNSTLVLRPADVEECTVAWRMAMENTHTPTALILSRQNIADLPAATDRKAEAVQAEKGGYIVECDGNPDVILVASGSEVSTLFEGAKLLRADGVKIRLVSSTIRRFIPQSISRISRKRIANRCKNLWSYCRSSCKLTWFSWCKR